MHTKEATAEKSPFGESAKNIQIMYNEEWGHRSNILL